MSTRLPVHTPRRFERHGIESWLLSNHTCPVTGEELQLPVSVVPNLAVAGEVEEWLQQHPNWQVGDFPCRNVPCAAALLPTELELAEQLAMLTTRPTRSL